MKVEDAVYTSDNLYVLLESRSEIKPGDRIIFNVDNINTLVSDNDKVIVEVKLDNPVLFNHNI